MKITSLELFKVAPRWLFLKTVTDEGICGWGEPVIEGRADTVEAAVKELSTYLIGKDPFEIEDTFQTLYRGGFYRGGPVLSSAISGIEQTLWDIKAPQRLTIENEHNPAGCFELLREYEFSRCRPIIKPIPSAAASL